VLVQSAQAGAFTLRCKGTRSWVAGTGGTTASERVINYYTLELGGSPGQIYGWHEHAWSTLRDDDPGVWHLEQQRQGMSWRLSIGRSDGIWSEVWESQGRTISISGSCAKAPLRAPPTAPQ
jgi:hypothetical protein